MMKLTAMDLERGAGHSRLVAHVERDRGRSPIKLFFEYPRESAHFLAESADVFVPALLVPCMLESEALEIVPVISARLYSSIDTIQNILSQWWRQLRRVEVTATANEPTPSTAPRTSASFFSGGVDSFYTCLKHVRKRRAGGSPPLTHLVRMEGVEKPLEQSVDPHELHDELRRVAEHYELDVVLGRTNIRSIFPLSWGNYYHGAGLSSIGHSLARGFRRILIPSTYSFRHLFPWGSHPLLDPLWSTEQTEIMHDGCEVTRFEKTALIANDPFALERLRVCIHNAAGPGNCGRCKKCIRTMVTLEALGALRQAKNFPDRLPDDFDRLLPMEEDHDGAFVEEIVSFLEQRQPGNPMAKKLALRLRQTRRHDAARNYVHNSALESALPAVRVLRGAAHLFAGIVGHAFT